MRWYTMAHAKFMDYQRARMLKEAGGLRVGVGVEAGSDARLKEIGKGITKDYVRRVLRGTEAGGHENGQLFHPRLP